MSRSYALGSEFEAFIDHEVDSGRYQDADEVVRDGLRLLGALPEPGPASSTELRRLVEEARRDPNLVDPSEMFGRLEAKYERAARAKQA